jgi:peptidoglycan/xylan/chitin deacetylase (PgdA/CDA1 family)
VPGRGQAGLRRQLGLLARVATVVPLGGALRSLAAGRPLPPRAVALTFDDGYADNLTLAVPMLQHLGLPATFFLVPGLLSNETQPWWEVAGWAFARATRSELDWEGVRYSLAGAESRWSTYCLVAEQLKRRNLKLRSSAVADLVGMLRPQGSPRDKAPMLDWDGARQLRNAGLGIASHSCEHAIFAEDQLRDLTLSKALLERELEAPVHTLAYPNGIRLDFGDVRSARQPPRTTSSR